MEGFNVYRDMQARTNGEIYIGVVGPVRSGKSTFIKKFMDTIVIPNIEDDAARDRAVDELPQSEDLVLYLLKEFEENPAQIWESNIFGKSLHELVNEGMHNKLYRMPEDARGKVRETIERIINDGCNGLICIIL